MLRVMIQEMIIEAVAMETEDAEALKQAIKDLVGAEAESGEAQKKVTDALDKLETGED
jgi:RNA binding exosome subunit